MKTKTSSLKRQSVSLLLAVANSACSQTTWTEKLLTRFSERWSRIQSEFSSIEKELKTLPNIPLENPGGTGGLLAYKSQSPKMDIIVHWGRSADVDMLVLVPARRQNVDGLEPEFGLPNFIEIELLDKSNHPVYLVAREHAAANRPIQRGFPFVYSLPKPVSACGVRIRCNEFKRHEFTIGPITILALAELFCFSGQCNVAEGAAVEVTKNPKKDPHWFWDEEFLTDGLTPLGLPEIPSSPVRHVGWQSHEYSTEDTNVYIDIQFDHLMTINGLRLFPAQRESLKEPPGFAFPQRFRLISFDEHFLRPRSILADCSDRNLINPGHSPVTLRFPETTVQYIRLDCSKLWKPFPNYPAFLAFSEIQLLHGETCVSQGVQAKSPDTWKRIGHDTTRWNEESLTNGSGSKGRLIPRREWLLLLDQRRKLETRQLNLQAETKSMAATLQKQMSLTFSGIGSTAILGLLILPVCYRFRERRLLNRMRQRLAGNLHDEVGSNLGSIQILADLSCKQNSVQEIYTISQIAAETVSAVRDIVWLLRPHAIHRTRLVDHLRQTASIMLKSVEWSFHAKGMENVSLLNDEDRSNLLLFYREALHNLIRHATANKAEIILHKDENLLTLEIKDNGCGIEPEKLEQPATLRALKQRAQRMHGELAVFSVKGKGTRLVLRIPLDLKPRKRSIWRTCNENK